MQFFRKKYNQMWLVMTANKPLGQIGDGYIEDYDGVSSQITLHNIDTNTRQSILFTDDSPTVLKGYANLDNIINGNYVIEGHIRDLLGNDTIISDFHNTIDGAYIEIHTLTVSSGIGVQDVHVSPFSIEPSLVSKTVPPFQREPYIELQFNVFGHSYNSHIMSNTILADTLINAESRSVNTIIHKPALNFAIEFIAEE